MTEMLPKEDLAHLADSLVNLTAFKRRVSLDIESVGGPIDVAVISKGDGFIWISRSITLDRNSIPPLVTIISANTSTLREPLQMIDEDDENARTESLERARLAALRALRRRTEMDPEADADRDAEKFAKELREALKRLPNPN